MATNNKEGVVMKEKIIALIKGYDLYCFERDGWEGTVAEAQNNKIKKEFFEIISSLGYRMSNKDFMDIMNAVHGLDSRLTAEEVAGKIIKKEEKAMMNQSKKPETNNKEVTDMDFIKKYETAFTNAKSNSDKEAALRVMLHEIEQQKIKKDVVLKLAEMFNIKAKTKAEAMTGLESKHRELCMTAEADEDAAKTVVAEKAVAVTDNVIQRRAKLDKLFGIIKYKAKTNEKNGFGYTISFFILKAAILEAWTGLKKLKGHEVTEEEGKIIHDVYHWLRDKGYIVPVVYSVKEDPNVRIYMSEYKGKTSDTTVRMLPYNKSVGYTAKTVTSFTVNL